MSLLVAAVRDTLQRENEEDRFLLASYYLDGRKLHEIAALLGVHEATVSRKLKRVTSAIRKQIVRALERRGMSRREAEEALAADPRDLTAADQAPAGDSAHELKSRELLQFSEASAFKEQAEP